MLGLTILGAPSLHLGGTLLPLTVRKTLALLILLARSGVSVPRARVVSLLWPDLDETTGRRNLRRELARLRESGAGDTVRAEGDVLALATVVRCDVDAFDAALAAGRPDEALALWRGPLADGFALGDADAFDEWLAREREQLGERRQAALRASAAAREAAGDVAGALVRVEALLADDPLQEQHHRDAMRLLAASGRREAALAQFERCRALLRAELGLEPMAETELMASALRGPASAAKAQAPPSDRPASSSPAAAVSSDPTPTSRSHAWLPSAFPFVGRNEEVARLEAAWNTGRPIVVEGEAGVGKTRLATDFAAAHGPFALARCRAGDAELPYASFTRALRALMGPASALSDLPEWVGRELARLMPELGSAPTPIRSDEERSRFFEACARGWQALSADNFDAVVLDDWHLADAASRTLLGFIAKRRTESAAATGARELLVMRPELDRAASESRHALIDATGALHLRLETLPTGAVLDLVRQLSGASHPVRFAERLERATGGNPFFLAETLRHLAEIELLSADAVGSWHTPFDEATRDYQELPMPASVLETVLARVQRLPAASRRVLEAAALAAEPFAPSLLASACALSELDAVLAIEEAVAASLLQEHAAGGFAFAHDLVQQALNSALSPERRRLVHRRLALGAEAAKAAPATIATHHEASGDSARAVVHRIAAGDRAQRLHALPEAMAHWTRALADRPTPSQALALHERLLRVAHQRSEIDVVRAQADALGTLLASGALDAGERVDAAIGRGLAMAQAGQADQALLELDALPAAIDELQRGRMLRARCIALLNLSRSEEALLVAQEALALPSLADADRVEMLDLAFINDNDSGRIESALVHVDAALALGRRIGDEHGIARGRFRRGILRLQMHDVAEAESEMLAAIEGAGRLGLVNMERIVLYNLTCVYSSESRYPQALATLERGWALLPRIQPSPLRVMYLTATVDANVALGDLGGAWKHAELAVSETLSQEDPSIRLAAAMCVLELLWLLGETSLARRLLASVALEEARRMRRAAEELWVALAQFELKQGDAEAAARALAEIDSDDVIVARVGMRLAQARAELALARHDPAAALAALPADDAVGMNGEMRTRGLALRVAAEAAFGRLSESTVAAAEAHFAAPSDHQIATLELHTALARAARTGAAGVPASAEADHAGFVAAMAETLRDYPAQQAAFRRAWG